MTRFLLLALTPVLAALATSQPARAKTVHALVIGIDQYDTLSDLNGAVNDARIIAEALNKRNADEVVLLLDGAATRERIFAEARRLAEAAARQSGWLIITYAGHGGQETERIAGDEEDGLDEVFLLSGFNTKGKQSG